MEANESPRAIAWGKVSKTWSTGSACCLRCDHRMELGSSAVVDGNTKPAVTVQFCGVLETGTGNDYLKCPGVIAESLLSIAPHRQNYTPERRVSRVETMANYVLGFVVAALIVIFLLAATGALKVPA